MKITVGQILVLFAGLIAILQKENIMDASGNVPQPMAVDAIGRAAVDVEQLLKAHGLVIDGKVDQIIALVPIVLAAVK